MKLNNRSIKNIIKKIVRKAGMAADDAAQNVITGRLLRKQNLTKGNTARPVRVGFLVQMPEIWDKEEPVYRQMLSDQRFDVSLVVVPPFDRVRDKVGTTYENNYFLKEYKEAITAYQGRGWIDLHDRFDYIFFQRPYDEYLPEELQSRNVVKYAKCCYIPYAFSGADVFNGGNTNKRFFRNFYFSFPESEYMTQLLKKEFSPNDRLHHFEYLGYPALAPYYDIGNSRQSRNILWTPRWSYDPKIGGSTFLENKDAILQIQEMYPGDRITFRPHPLMFGELELKKRMTREEIISFQQAIAAAGIIYDTGDPIVSAIRDADILITDYSSIIIQYFITGKPVIYCEGGIKLNSVFEAMSEGFYIARDKDDIIKYINMLKNGNDELADKRKQIIADHLEGHRTAAKKITERIYSDYTAEDVG